MDRRSLLAIALSITVLVAWQIFVVPKYRPAPAPPPPAQEAAPAEAAPAPGPGSAPHPAEAPAPAAVAATEKQEFIVETAASSVRFANEGGRILSWRLLKYVDDLDAPLELVTRDLPGVSEYPLRISIPGDDAAALKLDAALYRHELRDALPEDAWPGGGFKGRVVTFTYADGQGLAVTKRLALPADGYVGAFEVLVTRGGAPAPFEATWAVGLPETPGDGTTRYFHAEGNGVAHIGAETRRFVAKGATEQTTFTAGPGAGALQWAGLESTYFASLLLPEKVDTGTLIFAPVHPTAPAGAKGPEFLAARLGAGGEARYTLMVGPKDYDLLSGLGRDLDHAIDFSRFTIIYAVTKWLFLALRWLNGYVGNYGFSIVLLTILIRTAFFPLTYRSAITMRQNMKKMQRIQPRVKAIQERYRKMKRSMETQRQMNDEIMGVYRKEGMNPMGGLGGCLPLLLQMPVFIAFYNLLSVTIELRGAPFMLWIHDLSRMDPYYVWPILMGISWLVQQWMTGSSIPDPVQRRMMSVMPLIFTFMMASMPSGLVVYWFVSNVIGLAQQWYINRKADALPAQ